MSTYVVMRLGLERTMGFSGIQRHH